MLTRVSYVTGAVRRIHPEKRWVHVHHSCREMTDRRSSHEASESLRQTDKDQQDDSTSKIIIIRFGAARISTSSIRLVRLLSGPHVATSPRRGRGDAVTVRRLDRRVNNVSREKDECEMAFN